MIHLPSGVIAVATELRLPAGAHDLTIAGNHTTLRASADFGGRAMLSCRGCQRIQLRNLTIEGNREALEKPIAIPASNQTFASVFPNNGILLEDADVVSLDHIDFVNITNFA